MYSSYFWWFVIVSIGGVSSLYGLIRVATQMVLDRLQSKISFRVFHGQWGAREVVAVYIIDDVTGR
jgi:hypothetical protein